MSTQELCVDCDPKQVLPTTTEAPISAPPPDLPKPAPQIDPATFSPPKVDGEVPRVIIEVNPLVADFCSRPVGRFGVMGWSLINLPARLQFCDRCRWLHRATWTLTEL